MRILVVEDETQLLQLLDKRLRQEGYSVDSVADGEQAILYADVGDYDCIILDIMLPKVDGLTVLKTLRDKRQSVPVLLLTARDSIKDRVKGLDSGADDYLVKPCSYDELSARVRALLRRESDNKSNIINVGDLSLNLINREVTRAGQQITLSAKEYSLLEYMMRNVGRTLTRGQIIEHVWNFDFDNDSNVVDVYIRYLRSKIDDSYEKKLIHTVRGAGYVMRA